QQKGLSELNLKTHCEGTYLGTYKGTEDTEKTKHEGGRMKDEGRNAETRRRGDVVSAVKRFRKLFFLYFILSHRRSSFPPLTSPRLRVSAFINHSALISSFTLHPFTLSSFILHPSSFILHPFSVSSVISVVFYSDFSSSRSRP